MPRPCRRWTPKKQAELRLEAELAAIKTELQAKKQEKLCLEAELAAVKTELAEKPKQGNQSDAYSVTMEAQIQRLKTEVASLRADKAAKIEKDRESRKRRKIAQRERNEQELKTAKELAEQVSRSGYPRRIGTHFRVPARGRACQDQGSDCPVIEITRTAFYSEPPRPSPKLDF